MILIPQNGIRNIKLNQNIMATISISIKTLHSHQDMLEDTITPRLITLILTSTMYTDTETTISTCHLIIIGTGILTTIVITVHKEWPTLKITPKLQIQHIRTTQLKLKLKEIVVMSARLVHCPLSLRQCRFKKTTKNPTPSPSPKLDVNATCKG